MTNRSTIPALVEAIKTWFPEMEGRVVAVSEAEVTPENMPALPLAMVALQKITGTQNARSNARPMLTEDILVQFWLKPERERLAKGSLAPFWTYYDYDAILDRLLLGTTIWVGPRGTGLGFNSMDIEADEFAVTITFRLTHETRWCPPDEADARPEDLLLVPQPVTNDIQIAFGIEPAERPAGQPCECVPAVPNCTKCQERTYP